MVAPLRGTPDGGYQKYSIGVNQSDLGSLGDRLLMGGGSISKTGRVIWATGFEDTLATVVTQADGTGSIALNSANPYQGNNSVLLTTDATIGHTVNVSKAIFPQSSRLGIESMVSFVVLPPARTYDLIIINTNYNGNGRYYKAAIRINIVTPLSNCQLQYLGADGAYHTIKDISGYIQDFAQFFHMLKFVYDLSLQQYVRVFFDDQSVDLTGTAGYNQTAAAYNETVFQQTLTTQDVAVSQAYIDNWILTADEP